MEQDSSVLYYLARQHYDEAQNSHGDDSVETKKKKKKKSKNKKKKDHCDAIDEETTPLLQEFKSGWTEQISDTKSLACFDHLRPKEEEETTEPITQKSNEPIRIFIQCLPVAEFDLVVNPTRKVEEIMTDIAEYVWRKYNTKINVRGLQYTGEGSVHKGVPIDYAIGELFNDQEEVIVEFTTPVEATETMSFENTRVSDDESEEEKDSLENSKVYICPFRFDGPTANRDLKLHLANLTQMPTHLPKSDRGETIQCPLYFFNEEDAHLHIQNSVRENKDREDPDLRTFWERNEETIKVSTNLIKDEDQKSKRLQLDRMKKKVKKKKVSMRKREQREEKVRQEQEKEVREREEKEAEKRKKMEQEKKRKEAEIYKGTKSIIFDAIVKKVEIAVDTKQMEAEIQAKKKKKNKSKVKSEELTGAKPDMDEEKQSEAQIISEKETKSIPKPIRQKAKSKQSLKQNAISDGFEIQEDITTVNRSIANMVMVTPKKKSTQDKHYSQGLTNRLHNEIEEYVKLLQLAVESQKVKAQSMIAQVRKVVSMLWPSAQVELFGSHATSLCIPSSDLDLVVIGAHQENGEHPISLLSRQLQKERWIATIQSIETARVPVIKLISKEERISTDISFELKNSPAFCTSEGLLAHHEGLASCELVNNFKKKFPQITPLALLLKQLLCERSLNNVYTGGLSSYCLVMMIVNFLQLTEKADQKNLGTLFLDFLDLYGKRFEYSTQGISVSNGGAQFNLSDHQFPQAALVIMDPFNPMNNIAQQVIGISRIRVIFEDVYKTLVSPFYGGFTPGDPILNRVLKPEFIQRNVKT